MGQIYKVIKGAPDIASPQTEAGEGSIPAPGSAPVIFLDVDGVLNNNASLALGCHLLPEKVLLLRILCDLTDARMVISSAWRDFMRDENEGLCPFRFAMHKVGLPVHRIIGRTGPGFESRGRQINEWILEHKPFGMWVILDDEEFDFHDDAVMSQRFVQTDGTVGLTWRDCQKALRILGRNNQALPEGGAQPH